MLVYTAKARRCFPTLFLSAVVFLLVFLYSLQQLERTSISTVAERDYDDNILVLNFNFPLYQNVDLLKTLYEGVFDRVIICGPSPRIFISREKPDIIFDVEDGHFSYHCLALAIQKYPNYKGYFYGNDDMIINWWTMINRDKLKIWHGTKVIDWRQDAYGDIVKKSWMWWKTPLGIEACRKYYTDLKSLAKNSNSLLNALKIYLLNGNGRPHCAKGWSDFFYIPGHLSKQYAALSHIAYKNKLYLEIAVHNILRSLNKVQNLIILDGVYLPDEGLEDYTARDFWNLYNHQVAFVHPFKFHEKEDYFSRSSLKSRVINFKQILTDCS